MIFMFQNLRQFRSLILNAFHHKSRPPDMILSVRKFLLSLLALFLLFAWMDPTHAEVTSERQKQLIHLLRHDCGSCHGMYLKGGLGPALTQQALAGKSAEFLENTIYLGREENAMPAWKGLLTGEEIHWLVEKMQSGELP